MKFHPELPTKCRVILNCVLDRDDEGRLWLYVPGLNSLNLTAMCDRYWLGAYYLARWAGRVLGDCPLARSVPDMAACDFVGTAGEL